MDLSSILTPDAIRVSMNTSSKKRLLQDMADIAGQVHGLPAQAVYEAMQERESLGPTGMGGGVAIPHARLPQLDRVVGLFASLALPVDFEALDRRPVDLVFVLLAPAEAGAEHLRALARVSRTLRDATICGKLRSATNAAALYALMTDESASQAA